MAKKKNKLNKSNSSGWLDNFSEELVINKYAPGGPIELPNDSGLSPSQIAQLNTLKKQQEYLSSDKAKKSLKEYKQSELSKKAQEKQSTVSTKKEKSLKDKVKEAAYNPLATLTGTETGNKYDEFLFGTPAMMANSAINTVGNVFSPSAYGAVGKGLVNMAPALANMALDTDYQPIFNDGSSDRALEIGADALMALPLTQALPKGVARKTVDLFHPVGRQLRQIEKIGLQQGLSPKDIKKLQLEKVGITSLQREGYTPGISEIVSEYITPYSYDAPVARILNIPKRIIKGETNAKKASPLDYELIHQDGAQTLISNPRYDAWRMYSGLPQKNKTFRIAETSPINHPNYTAEQLSNLEKFSLNNEDRLIRELPSYYDNINLSLSTDTKELANSLDDLKSQLKNIKKVQKQGIDYPESDFTSTNVMGGYNRRFFDNKMEYNDIWDLNLKGVPVEKYFGKPFMSHGQLDYSFEPAISELNNLINKAEIAKNTITPYKSNVITNLPQDVFDNSFKNLITNSSISKSSNKKAYGGEINQYADGGNAKNKKSTLSKLKKALSLRENLGNLNTEQGYNTPLNQILRTAVGMEGKDLSNESMDPIAREQDAFRMYLGLPTRTGAFEQTGPNKYRIRDYNKLYPDTLLSDEAVRDWGTPNEDGVPDPVNQAFDLYPYDDFVMGKHYITKGKDAKGEYLRYYDKFDLDPTRRANQYIDRNINPRVGKYLKKATPILDELENLMFNPFELEDKVYYDPKTKLRSDIILQQNKQKVIPGQPVAIPAEFQDGGNIGNTLETNPYYKEANQFLLDYYNSPRYKEMISESAPENANYFTDNRINNLSNIPPLNLLKKDKGLQGGFSDGKTGEISIYPSDKANTSSYLHELVHSSDRPITKQDLKNNNRLIPEYDKQLVEKLLYPNLQSKLSEESWNKYTDSEKKEREKFYSNKIKNYVGTPEEVRARLLEIRKSGKDANIYDPFTQKVDYPILKKLLMSESERLQKNDKGNYPLLDLIEGFDADGVLQMLNEISQNKDENSLPLAKDGGKINDDNGYLISNLDNFTPKKIINSNYITTNNMAFPVDANGVILYPNTGDYIFPTNKVIETPIMQEGGKINNDMKKKFKKYQGGGYLDYQDAYKGFGVGPNLTQDNSYYRTAVPGTIENIQEEINQPSALAGLNNVLGGIDQIASQGIGLVGNFMQSKMSGAMGDMGGMGDISYVPMEQSVANNLTQDPKAGTGLMGGAPTLETAPSSTGSYNWNMMGSPGNFNWNLGGNQGGASALSSQADISAQLPEAWKGVPFLRNGGYLKRYQEGGMTEMPVGYPEYIHKSNVFQPHVIPVPKVHFSDDTSVFDMGVNLNDLVQMNGGGISKYQYGGFMTQPRTFNSNSQRMNAAQLSAATENDFMHTKLRNDRQQFADNKVDWGFMNWAKEPTGAYLGMMSTVPILGDTVKNVLGDSFLTRTSGYQVGQGVGKSSLGAAKLVAGVPKGDVSMILGGVGDIGEGVGGAVGNLNAKSAMGDYNKQGYVSGKRLANAAVDFNTTMGLSSKLYGMGKSIVDLGNDPSAKNLQTFLNNKNPYNRANKGQNDLNFLLGQFMPGLSGDGADGGEMAMGGYLNNYQEGGMVFLPEDLEIPKYKKGGLTPTKARQMLHDKSYSTDKQRKYFGYISSQKKSNGGWIDTL